MALVLLRLKLRCYRLIPVLTRLIVVLTRLPKGLARLKRE
jgi:hypothetical protein